MELNGTGSQTVAMLETEALYARSTIAAASPLRREWRGTPWKSGLIDREQGVSMGKSPLAARR